MASAQKFGSIDITTIDIPTLMFSTTRYDNTVNLICCNRNSTNITIRIAIISSTDISTLTNADYIVYDKVVSANDYLEFKAIVLGINNSIIVQSNTINVNFLAYGFGE